MCNTPFHFNGFLPINHDPGPAGTVVAAGKFIKTPVRSFKMALTSVGARSGEVRMGARSCWVRVTSLPDTPALCNTAVRSVASVAAPAASILFPAVNLVMSRLERGDGLLRWLMTHGGDRHEVGAEVGLLDRRQVVGLGEDRRQVAQ